MTGEMASTIGWKELALCIEDELKQMEYVVNTLRAEDELKQMGDVVKTNKLCDVFVLGLEYKVPAQLAYHLPGRPETLGPHFCGLPGQQYTYWALPDTLIGINAICVVDPRWGVRTKDAEPILKKYFGIVEKAKNMGIIG